MQFLFTDYTLDTDRRELRRGSQPIAVEPQVFDLLVYLMHNRDRVVSKDDLIASVWKGRIVSESTLTSRINAARTAIGDSGKDQRLIRTVARKGLRFVAIVREAPIGVEGVRRPDPPDEVHPQPISLPLSERPAIAVLPFTNMSDDPEQEYFSDGISEDIITALSKLRWFLVIARNSSFVYKGKAVHIKQVAEELGVGYVVEGSVRRSGEQVRITAQLNDVTTGSHIWAEHYDRHLTDVFAVQDDITESIVAAIEPQLYAAENFRARRKLPDSMDAWDLVMRALSYYWRVTRQDNVVAQALLEKAIAIDPNYGQALGLLATSQTFSAHMGWADMAATIPIAERAALAAILADSEDPWAHNAFAVRIRTGTAVKSEFFPGAGLLRTDAVVLRALGRGRPRRPACAALEPARSVFSDLLRHRRLCPVHRAQLRRGHASCPRSHPATQRFRRRPPGADGRLGDGRADGSKLGCPAGTPPRSAEYFAGLDRHRDADGSRR
jgi:TolB-like protein